MAGFNIQNFKAILEGNKGLLHNNSFLVEFPRPAKLESETNKEMMFYCKSAPLPGIGILTSDVIQYGTGPIERKPYATVVNDAMMYFYVDGAKKVRTFFKDWVGLIINPNSKNGMTGPNRRNAQPYELAYKKDYQTDITITAFNKEGKAITKVVLIEAYPNYIGDVMLDWSDKNTLMMLPVSITYRDWYEETI